MHLMKEYIVDRFQIYLPNRKARPKGVYFWQ